MSRAVLPAHGLQTHSPNGPDPLCAHFCIALSAEDETPSTGNGLWTFAVEHDWSGTWLRRAEAYVSTAGSSVTQIQLHNVAQAADLLTSRIEIDSGEKMSWESTPLAEVDPDNDPVLLGEEIRIDLDAIGSGATGLKLMLTFGPRVVHLT